MEKIEISKKVKEIVVSVLKHEQFEMRDDLTASEVEGWDSLTHMSIITSIEEGLKVRFKLREINKLKTMGTLIELIESKL